MPLERSGFARNSPGGIPYPQAVCRGRTPGARSEKEYIVNELEWKLESVRESGANNFAASDTFKALMGEINKLNTSNGVFIEKSLSYWQDLMGIFMPPSYGPTGKASRRMPSSPRGAAFSREV